MRLIYFIVTLVSLNSSTAFACMCAREPKPIAMRVRVLSCDSKALTVEILKNLPQESTVKEKPENNFIKLISNDSCEQFPVGAKVEITVKPYCCDAQIEEGFFGSIIEFPNEIKQHENTVTIKNKTYKIVDGQMIELAK